MRVRLPTLLAAGVIGLSVLVAAPAGAVSAVAAPTADDSGFILSTTQPGGPGQAPMLVGNGYLAGRQPFDGQGFAQVQLPGRTEPLPTQSQVHGFYAVAVPFTPPGLPPSIPVERRAALPAWSTLSYNDGSGAYSLSSGHVDNYLQSLDALKEQSGQDIVVTGSITLCHTLIRAGLVDEYRLLVYPVVQGRGRRLFPDGFELPKLKLLEAKAFRSGITYSRYTLP